MDKLEQEVLAIAEYLGCNGGELWSELKPIFLQRELDARIDELKHIDYRETWSEYSGIKSVGERIAELKARKETL